MALQTVAMLGLLVAMSLPVAAQQNVMHSVTAPEIRELLTELGMKGHEIDSDGDVMVMIHGYRAWVMIGSLNGRQLQIMAPFDNTRLSLADVNRWNRINLPSKAVLQDDGEVVLDSYLDMDGGVTRDRIKDWMQFYVQSLNEFVRDMIQGAGAGSPAVTPARRPDLAV